MQGQFGFPSVFRLSDPEETDVAFKLYGVEGTPLDPLLTRLGYRPGERCLLLGHTDGDRDLGKLIKRKSRPHLQAHGALTTTGYVTSRWEHGRFRDPYMREDLGDFGIVLDTLECGVNWTNLPRVWAGVRDYVHSRPRTICMCHASHFYPQGTNLYFIFIARMDRHRGVPGVPGRHPGRDPEIRGDDEPPPRHRQDDGAVAGGSDRHEPARGPAGAQAAL